jgi:hypothetical protein
VRGDVTGTLPLPESRPTSYRRILPPSGRVSGIPSAGTDRKGRACAGYVRRFDCGVGSGPGGGGLPKPGATTGSAGSPAPRSSAPRPRRLRAPPPPLCCGWPSAGLVSGTVTTSRGANVGSASGSGASGGRRSAAGGGGTARATRLARPAEWRRRRVAPAPLRWPGAGDSGYSAVGAGLGVDRGVRATGPGRRVMDDDVRAASGGRGGPSRRRGRPRSMSSRSRSRHSVRSRRCRSSSSGGRWSDSPCRTCDGPSPSA